jgi:peptide-methionine (S)-S-oxide reductase
MKRLLLAAAALALLFAAPAPKLAKATFSGGCFWCMEPPFERVAGVVSAVSGYTGRSVLHPTYEQVSDGVTGHRESVEVTYDPAKVSYARLLDVFWHNVDPTDPTGQFCDHGSQYRTAIFVHDAEQRRLAEEYHQDYAKKNPVRYNFYRFNCGRDQKLERIWGKAPEH